MAISKVEIRNSDGTKNVLVDLTGDTVSTDTLAEGITAHGADGEKITGTLHKTTRIIQNADSVEFKDWSSSPDNIRFKKAIAEDIIFKTGGSGISIDAKASEFGDATPEDVAKGKTFTSASGLKVTGTLEPMVSNDNCEAYQITSASTALNFKRTDGTIKVWGYGYKSSGMYQKTVYAFCGDGYYTGSSYMNPTKTSVTWGVNSDGTLSGLPSGLNALDVLVTKGVQYEYSWSEI